MQLTSVAARRILNSRREAAIEVIAESNGLWAVASAPQGASKGKNEVRDVSSRGIDFSISFINVLGRKLASENAKFERFEDLERIESEFRKYDKTANLEFVGGNALYAFEAAVVKLMALSSKQEVWRFLSEGKGKKPKMPRPVCNCIGGGMHTSQPIKADFQEFLIIPDASSFFDACFISQQAYKEARELLEKRNPKWNGNLTAENALAPPMDNDSILSVLDEVRKKIRKVFDTDVDIGIDMAASSFFRAGKYRYLNFGPITREKALTREEQIKHVLDIAKKYSLAYIEDPLQSSDFDGFAKIRARAGAKTLICGDDLTCTHPELVEKAARNKAINAVIIKPNQIGSLLETKKAVDIARKKGVSSVISHRSGETEDDFISDICIAWGIPFIKAGIAGRERMAKLNRIMKIEKENA